MKNKNRITIIRLSLTVLLAIAAWCGRATADDAEARDPSAWKAIKPGLHSGFGSVDVAYSKSIPPAGEVAESIKLQGWKGERVHCQLLVWSSGAEDNISITASGFSGEQFQIDRAKVSISVVDYVLIDRLQLKLVGSGTPTAKEKYDLFTYTGSFSGDIAGIIDDTGVTGWPTPSISGQDTGRIYVVFGVLPGDTNEDGVVDAVDYIAIKTNFGLSGTGITRLMGDLIDNDIVDWADLQELMDQFGTRSVGGAPPAPEPATLGLLAIGALAVIRRRQGYGGQVRRRRARA